MNCRGGANIRIALLKLHFAAIESGHCCDEWVEPPVRSLCFYCGKNYIFLKRKNVLIFHRFIFCSKTYFCYIFKKIKCVEFVPVGRQSPHLKFDQEK